MAKPDYLAAHVIEVRPIDEPLIGEAVPPGSKSITNRALLLAALADGTSHITGALKSDDTRYMCDALRAMGVRIDEPDATSITVSNDGRLCAPKAPLFLGNAGTATRFLTAVAASIRGSVVLDGDEHMRRRPIAPLVDTLHTIGVNIEAPTGCPPVTVHGTGNLPAGRYEIDGNLSSQYVSALLIAAPLADGPVDIVLTGDEIGARGYIDLTLNAMRSFGAEIHQMSSGHWRIEPKAYAAIDIRVEPDASAATYLWAAAALTGGSIDIGVAAEAFTQPDAHCHELIAAFPNMPEVVDGSQMQDAVPTLAVLAAYNNTQVRFTGIENLRVKECDRVAALHQGLNRIRPGLAKVIGNDLVVHGNPNLAGLSVDAEIDVFADHRVAMCFALAGLKTGGIRIRHPGCVAKTFPSYWDVLDGLGVELNIEG